MGQANRMSMNRGAD